MNDPIDVRVSNHQHHHCSRMFESSDVDSSGEALEKDCLAYFATADLLLARHEDANEALFGVKIGLNMEIYPQVLAISWAK